LGDAAVFAVSTTAGTNGGASILASALRRASRRQANNSGEQLLRRQAMTTRDTAGPNAFLEALGHNRRLLSGAPTSPPSRASENLDPPRRSLSLRYVLTL
jgi:hypothetical protein